MARWPRLTAAGLPLHITQRGHNQDATFLDDQDFGVFRAMLATSLERTPCALHAYVLMTNHVHFLLTPERPGNASRLMQSLTGAFVRYWNKRHRRSGTLWGGRFHSSIVGTDRYVLACTRYIDRNPVRAGIVAAPEMYEWSSHRALAFGARDPLVTPHRVMRDLGVTPEAATVAYRALCAGADDAPVVSAFRVATRGGAAIGTASRLAELETQLRHPLTRGTRGGNRRQLPVPRPSWPHHGV